MNRRELEQAIRDEVEEWPGVSVEFVEGGKHPKAKFTYRDLMLSRPYASTPSDTFFGVHRMLGDMRRVMKQLGASRPRPEPSEGDLEKRYSKPNDGAAKRAHADPKPAATPEPTVAEKVEKAMPEQAAAAKAAAKPKPVTQPESKPCEIVYVADEDETDDEAARAKRLAELEALVDAVVDGVYFGMPDVVYHAVRALGSGSICDLIVSPGTFWAGSWLDPQRPELDEEATLAQQLGKAYHCARLEPDQFDQRYVRELDKADFPQKGMVTSDAAIKAALKDLGEQQTISTESNLDRAQRLRDAGYRGVIWALELEAWEAERNGREPIKGKYYDEILVDMERIRAVPDIASKLENGAPEVSIFWTDEHGIRCKARFDWLTAEHWVDFKTFANVNGKVLSQAISDTIRYNRHYVQAVHYRDAAEALRAGLPIVGEHTGEQGQLIAEIQARASELTCWYVYQEKGGIPNLLARRFMFFMDSGMDDALRELEESGANDEHLERARRMAEISSESQIRTGIHKLGRAEIEHAKLQFMLYAQVYPPGTPWAPIDPVGTIGDSDFNPFWLEGR